MSHRRSQALSCAALGRLTRRIAPAVVLGAGVGAVALPARADGISGGLAAARMLAIVALSVFGALWLIGWGVVRLTRRREAGRRYWLFEPRIPIGLRGLALVQYLLSFLYAAGALLQAMFPTYYENHGVARWVIQSIAFKICFSVLAIVSANAYLQPGDARGFRRGMALAWLCIANALVFVLWHGTYPGFDPVTAGYGVVLLLLLDGRYRRTFGCDRRLLSRLLRRALVTGLVGVPTLFGALGLLSFVLTGPLGPDRTEAYAVLDAVARDVAAYRAARAEWPHSLAELETDAPLHYRWHRVQYDPAAREIWLDVQIPLEEKGLAYRLSFGRVDGDNSIVQVIRPLEEPGAPTTPR